tara:strand:- start:257 stop:535 length:279 start_codon:yes stop_codon:yes gene_type:complete
MHALKEKRAEEISGILGKIDLKECDTYTIIGALLAALESRDPQEKEVRQKAGKKFCRTIRPQKSRSKQASSAPKATAQYPGNRTRVRFTAGS